MQRASLVRRTLRAHPVLTAMLITALLCGGWAVVWDRVDPGPEQITLIMH